MNDPGSLYFGHFYDDNHMASDGFDSVVGHIQKTSDIICSLTNFLEAKISAEDEYSRTCSKIAKPYSKGEILPNSIMRVLLETFNAQNTAKQKLCVSLTMNCTQPYKETYKKQLEIIKKIKNECNTCLKNRKHLFENANKACKNYTAKYKAHDVLTKKYVDQELDEKTKNKILKSHQTLQQAEKDAKVSTELLGECLIEYHDIFAILCRAAEDFDRTLIDEMHKMLSSISQNFTSFYSESSDIYAKLGSLSEATSSQAYCKSFVEEKGNSHTYPKFTGIQEIVSETKGTEFVLSVSENPVINQVRSVCSFRDSFSKKSDQQNTSELSVASDSSSMAPPSPFLGESSETADIIQPRIITSVVALYDFDPQEKDELAFKEGDKIEIIRQEDDSWYIGKLPNGTIGAFPITYVKNIES